MASSTEQEYSFAAVSRILGVAEAKLRYWSQSGFVGPSRRRGGRQTFTFQDLVAYARLRNWLSAASRPRRSARPWMRSAPRFRP